MFRYVPRVANLRNILSRNTISMCQRHFITCDEMMMIMYFFQFVWRVTFTDFVY